MAYDPIDEVRIALREEMRIQGDLSPEVSCFPYIRDDGSISLQFCGWELVLNPKNHPDGGGFFLNDTTGG